MDSRQNGTLIIQEGNSDSTAQVLASGSQDVAALAGLFCTDGVVFAFAPDKLKPHLTSIGTKRARDRIRLHNRHQQLAIDSRCARISEEFNKAIVGLTSMHKVWMEPR